MQSLNASPPRVHRELTCSKNLRVGEGEEAEQDENWGGLCCKGKGWIVGGYHKGGNNQEDEERVGGVCTVCSGEEELPSPILIWA